MAMICRGETGEFRGSGKRSEGFSCGLELELDPEVAFGGPGTISRGE